MPSIAKINKQLETVNENLEKWLPKLNCPVISIDSNVADIIEKLARTQKILIETQIAIFIEAQESDLDIVDLPTFCDEREDE